MYYFTNAESFYMDFIVHHFTVMIKTFVVMFNRAYNKHTERAQNCWQQ